MRKEEKMSKECEDREIEPINIEALIKASSENRLSELAVACQEQNSKDTEAYQDEKSKSK